MEHPFLNFIRSGVVGKLSLGQTRSDVVMKLGKPENWAGKPPCFGPIELEADKSEVWYYYGDAVAIGFHQATAAVAIAILPQRVNKQSPFEHWPIESMMTMGGFRGYLIEYQVPFYEDDYPDLPHHILAYQRCKALCSFYEKGRSLPTDERPITVLSVVIQDELLGDLVRGRRQREWSLLRRTFDDRFAGESSCSTGQKTLSAYAKQMTCEDLSALKQAIMAYSNRFKDDGDLKSRLISELDCYCVQYLEPSAARGWFESLISHLESR